MIRQLSANNKCWLKIQERFSYIFLITTACVWTWKISCFTTIWKVAQKKEKTIWNGILCLNTSEQLRNRISIHRTTNLAIYLYFSSLERWEIWIEISTPFPTPKKNPHIWICICLIVIFLFEIYIYFELWIFHAYHRWTRGFELRAKFINLYYSFSFFDILITSKFCFLI